MTGQMQRYAIYYAPPAGDLASAAGAWLGWDPARGRAVAQPAVAGADLAAATEAPRRYGFHGTLKPPFRLAEGTDRAALVAAIEAFARTRAPVGAGPLSLARIGRFLALVPDAPLEPLADLAAATVVAFEPFRAALGDAEIARRRPESLTPRQRDLLARFGYPYVMEEFRFHLTLSGPLGTEAGPIEAAARRHFAPWIGLSFAVRELCLFGEDAHERFHLLSRHPLAS
ncbi:MAG: DUF1045 domain-containing protein [Defluviimonas sp.]|uniref:DUF1045 domain-containing protein n=1 Tax=Albidovulum sp. TaxID=1872424 RepID=UPI001D92A45A|nr:DUF1045 domain-containing protein [Paracoccaceae bacterium]MCC0062892.1 DUF1045 domain-containing protein [Defluviimonas sp.]